MNRILCILLLCLLVLTGIAEGNNPSNNDILIKIDPYTTMFGNAQTIYYESDDGVIHGYQPDLNEINDVATIKKDEEYPFLFDGKMYVFNRKKEYINRLSSEADTLPIPIPITQGLAGGGDGWHLRTIKADKGALYFLYTDEGREVPMLCRFQFKDMTFDIIEIEWLREYVLSGDGEILAIAYTGTQTIAYAVDWQEKPNEVYRLKGQYAGFASGKEGLYAADINGLSFVLLRDGKEQMRVRSPYAAGVVAGHYMQGHYYALGSAGLYRPDFTVNQEPAQVLRVLEGYADEIDMAFMMTHPNVKLEYIPYSTFEGMDFSQALITGVISYDVAQLSNVTPAAENLMAKGYTMDLSQDPFLLKKAKEMYKPIKDFIFRDGKLMLMPKYVDVRGLVEYNEENMQAAGMLSSDLPKTMEEYLDFIIAWREEHGEPESSEDIVPVVGDENIYRMGLLSVVMETYYSYYRRIGQDLDFDTPEFRRLIEKTSGALDAMPVQTEMYGYRFLLEFGGRRVPRTNSIVFPIHEDETPKYTGYIDGYIIDPRSQVKDLALEYVAWRVKGLNALDNLMLYEGQYSAIERADYPANRDFLLREKGTVEEAIGREESEAEKRVLQNRLESLLQQIKYPSDIDKYQITDAEIQFYQTEIIPNLEFPFANITTEYSYANLDTWQLMKRYLDGELDSERFISELNQRQRLRRLENQ